MQLPGSLFDFSFRPDNPYRCPRPDENGSFDVKRERTLKKGESSHPANFTLNTPPAMLAMKP